jgi:hypothetical protein
MASGFDDGVPRVLDGAAAPPGGVAKGSDAANEGVDVGDIVGTAAAEVTTATAESVAPSADAALGFATRVSLATGPAPRWCHGFHQSTPTTSSTAATETTIDGQGKLLTTGASVRSLTLAGCEAAGLGAWCWDS